MGGTRARQAVLCATLLVATGGVFAETVTYDFGVYPPLANEVKKGEHARVVTDNQAPRYILTRIIVDGESPETWGEAIEIFNTLRRDEPRTPRKWYERLRDSADAACPGEWQVLSESDDSLTFARDTPACPPHAAQTALYRVLYGKPNVFALIATRKGGMTEETRKGWLAVLASAEIR